VARKEREREKVRSLLLLSSFLLFTPVEGEGRRLGEREVYSLFKRRVLRR